MLKLKLYDKNVIEFTNDMTFVETIYKIQTEILNIPKYQKYYGFADEDGNIDIELAENRDMTNERWLGIKPVGKDVVENVKQTLDIIAWVIINYNEYNTSKLRNRYFKLNNKKKINEKELEELTKLSEKIFLNKKVYGKQQFIIINDDEENRLLNKNIKKYEYITKIKEDIRKYEQIADSAKEDITKLKYLIRDCEIDKMKFLVGKIQELEDSLYLAEEKIDELAFEYIRNTELIHKTT